MRRERRPTKRERKAVSDPPDAGPPAIPQCVACGTQRRPEEFSASPPSAMVVVCDHGSRHAACVGCEVEARHLVAEHDRTGEPVSSLRGPTGREPREG